CEFSSDLSDLKALKAKNASNEIFAAMTAAQKKNQKEGIYYFNAKGEEVKIHPTVFSGSQNAGGLVTAKIQQTISGETSSNQISKTKPKFKVYFNVVEATTNQMSAFDWIFKTASNPNEFVMLRMERSRKERAVTTASVNVVGGVKSGVVTKDAIPFKITQISKFVFEIEPMEPMKDGEYCFFYKGAVPSGRQNQSVFDFTIKTK
ncbi:MAG: hypothetical protein MJ197_10600, partial [Bacteroidales bacterium]|nr:hypothetical protein [Bacteroidales bacterium]